MLSSGSPAIVPTGSAAQLHDRTAAGLSLEDLIEHGGQLVQRYRVAHLGQVAWLEVGSEPLPYLLTQTHKCVHGVYAEQAHAAQDKRHHGCIERVTCRQADARQGPPDLHGAGKPRQHVAAEVVYRACPSGFVEWLDARQIEAAAQHDLLRPKLPEVIALGFFAGKRRHVVPRFGEDVYSNTA